MKKVFLICLFGFNTAFAAQFDITKGCDIASFEVFDTTTNHAVLSAYFEPNTYTCASGYFLPANTDGCRVCPTGYTCDGGTFSFNKHLSQGITKSQYMTTSISDGCSDTLLPDEKMVATFTRNSYTCSEGYFLPANTDGCRICPTGYTCNGGTFYFNERQSQGINRNTYATTNVSNACSDNFLPIGRMVAVFVPNDPDVITVYFNNNGTVETKTCDLDGELTLPPAPTRVGYVFTGWKVKNDN